MGSGRQEQERGPAAALKMITTAKYNERNNRTRSIGLFSGSVLIVVVDPVSPDRCSVVHSFSFNLFS